MKKTLKIPLISGVVLSIFATPLFSQERDMIRDVENNPQENNTEELENQYEQFDQISEQRRQAWYTEVENNRARVARSNIDDKSEANKSIKDMEGLLEKWDEINKKMKNASEEDCMLSQQEITKLDRNMAEMQVVFNETVPMDSEDYKNMLESTVSQIDQAEKQIEQRLAFLKDNKEMLKDLKQNLSRLREEANDHMQKLDSETDESAWTELKNEIDTWMNENLNFG